MEIYTAIWCVRVQRPIKDGFASAGHKLQGGNIPVFLPDKQRVIDAEYARQNPLMHLLGLIFKLPVLWNLSPINLDKCTNLPQGWWGDLFMFITEYWLRSWWRGASWVSLPLPLSIISQAPIHPIEKEEAAKTYAKMILYFILLLK